MTRLWLLVLVLVGGCISNPNVATLWSANQLRNEVYDILQYEHVMVYCPERISEVNVTGYCYKGRPIDLVSVTP